MRYGLVISNKIGLKTLISQNDFLDFDEVVFSCDFNRILVELF